MRCVCHVSAGQKHSLVTENRGNENPIDAFYHQKKYYNNMLQCSVPHSQLKRTSGWPVWIKSTLDLKDLACHCHTSPSKQLFVQNFCQKNPLSHIGPHNVVFLSLRSLKMLNASQFLSVFNHKTSVYSSHTLLSYKG